MYIIDNDGTIWLYVDPFEDEEGYDQPVFYNSGWYVKTTRHAPLHLVPVLFDPAFGYGNIDFAPIWHEDT